MSRVDPISGRGTNPVFTRAALDKVTASGPGMGPAERPPCTQTRGLSRDLQEVTMINGEKCPPAGRKSDKSDLSFANYHFSTPVLLGQFMPTKCTM